MKYKKFLTLVTSMIFITALIFCGVMATKIAEIDVDAQTIENSTENVLDKSANVLNEYENKNIIFVSEQKLIKKLEESSSYVKVLNVDKVFPNKLKVEIKERQEVFSVCTSNEYYMLDADLKVLSKKTSNINNIDGSKNLLFKFNLADYDENSLKVNETLKFYDNQIENVVKTISEKSISRRLDISEVELITSVLGSSAKRVTFTMTEGVKITVTSYDERLSEKLDCLFDFYNNLDNKGDLINEYFVVIDSQTANVVVTK